MADRNNKIPQNISGAFYVDDSCTDCDLCRSDAPEFFTRHDATGYSYVRKQPVTSEEIALAQGALEGCPTDSIGNDGLAEG